MRVFFAKLIILLCLTCAGCHQTTTPGSFFPLQKQTTDATITDAIYMNMLNNDYLSAAKIQVVTTNGVVVLSGYVSTIRQGDTAEELARNTPGVVSVQNDIIVRK